MRLKTSYLFLGAVSIFGQVLAIRELMAALRGNELALSVSLGVWLASVGAASSLGGRLAPRIVGYLGDRGALGLWFAAISVMVPAVVVWPRFMLPVIVAGPGEVVGAGGAFFLIVSTLLLLTPFIGSLFPVCVYCTGGGTPGAAKVYSLEALGYCLAGGTFTFLAAPWFSPLQCAAMASFCCCCMAIWHAGERGTGRGVRFAVGLLSAIVIVFAGLMAINAKGAELFTLNLTRGAGRIIDARWSKYGVVSVAERSGQYAVFENGVYSFSVPDGQLVQKDAHLPMLMHQTPDDVLMVGGGGGMISEVLKHPVERLDYVELDPTVIGIYEEYMPGGHAGFGDGGRLHIWQMDGRRFIKETARRYDVIMVNLPDPATASVNRYYTREFFNEAKAALKPGGVFSTRLRSSEGYISDQRIELVGSELRTLSDVFAYVSVTPGSENHFFASDSPGVGRPDAEVLKKRYAERGIEAEGFTAYDIGLSLSGFEMEMLRQRIGDAGGYCLNRDFRPLAYIYSLGVWGEVAGLPVFGRLGPMARSGGRLVYRSGVVFAIVLVALLVFRRKSRTARAYYAVATTGFGVMGVEVCSLLAFQSYYGYLYEMLGALMASYMIGLYAGSAFGGWVVGRGRFRPGLVLLADGLVVGLCAGLAYIAANPAGAWFGMVIFGVIISCGLLTGTLYPLALELARGDGEARKDERRAGILYGFDLMGAGLSAVAVGLVLVPLLGIASTALCMVILKSTSFVYLLTGGARTR